MCQDQKQRPGFAAVLQVLLTTYDACMASLAAQGGVQGHPGDAGEGHQGGTSSPQLQQAHGDPAQEEAGDVVGRGTMSESALEWMPPPPRLRNGEPVLGQAADGQSHGGQSSEYFRHWTTSY